MQILILYATTEGQTLKIMRKTTKRLAEQGHGVELLDARDFTAEALTDRDALIVGASIHMGKFQKRMRKALTRAATALTGTPSLFLPVSLAAASDTEDDAQELDRIVTKFLAQTGWSPSQIQHIAGAFRFSKYDFMKSWAMRHIAEKRGLTLDYQSDTEFTDWPALDACVDSFVAALPEQSGR